MSNRAMLNQILHKLSFFKFSGVLMLIAIQLLFAGSTTAAEKQGITAEDPRELPCIGLKPFNNLNELLYQFYDNLESDCLFRMSEEELEAAWDTKIVSMKRVGPDQSLAQLIRSIDFENKPYLSPKDGFIISIDRSQRNPDIISSFRISMTEDFHKKFGYLLTPSNFPQKLPKSKLIMRPYSDYWESSDLRRSIILENWPSTHSITFNRVLECPIKKDN